LNLIILAAGVGRRLYPLTKDKPKSLLDIGDGSTLLDKQLTIAVQTHRVDKVFIVAGYKVEQIESKIKEYEGQIDCEIIYNPFFDVSNNLMSLWCAHHLMLEEDFLITNGDNIYKTHVYDVLINDNEEGIYILTDKKDHNDEDDMKVLFEDGQVSLISKQIDIDEAQAESVGFIRISGKKSRQLFYQQLLSEIRQENGRDEFWLEIFNGLCREGHKVEALEIGEHEWGEMDFHPDVHLMKEAIMKEIF